MSQKIWKIVSFVTFCESTWVRYFSTYCLLLVVSWQVVRKPRQVHMSVSDVFEGAPSFVSNILKWNSEETFNSYSGQHLHKYTFSVKGLHFKKLYCHILCNFLGENCMSASISAFASMPLMTNYKHTPSREWLGKKLMCKTEKLL